VDNKGFFSDNNGIRTLPIEELNMRTLLIVAAVGLGSFLAMPSQAQAQQNQFFGTAPVPFRWYSYAWDPVYGLMTTQRVGFVYPSSGYNWGFIRAYSPVYGFTTGYYRAFNNPANTSLEYYPTYYDPAYFTPTMNYPSPMKRASDYANKSYVTPQYYLPTY